MLMILTIAQSTKTKDFFFLGTLFTNKTLQKWLANLLLKWQTIKDVQVIVSLERLASLC
jgi:hypothetical protein